MALLLIDILHLSRSIGFYEDDPDCYFGIHSEMISGRRCHKSERMLVRSATSQAIADWCWGRLFKKIFEFISTKPFNDELVMEFVLRLPEGYLSEF